MSLHNTPSKPRVVDLYSCAGGIARGFERAGLHVVCGVDREPRPNYPYTLYQGDALKFLRDWISGKHRIRADLVHASPPCQAQNPLTVGTNASRGWGGVHEDLVGPTRDLLEELGLPYIIEQPDGRAEIRKDLKLCGANLGLPVIRHRNFELGGWSTAPVKHTPHEGRVRGWRHGQYHEGPYVAVYGSGGGKANVPEAQHALGIDWTDDLKELTEAIPPVMGELIGKRFIEWSAGSCAGARNAI